MTIPNADARIVDPEAARRDLARHDERIGLAGLDPKGLREARVVFERAVTDAIDVSTGRTAPGLFDRPDPAPADARAVDTRGAAEAAAADPAHHAAGDTDPDNLTGWRKCDVGDVAIGLKGGTTFGLTADQLTDPAGRINAAAAADTTWTPIVVPVPEPTEEADGPPAGEPLGSPDVSPADTAAAECIAGQALTGKAAAGVEPVRIDGRPYVVISKAGPDGEPVAVRDPRPPAKPRTTPRTEVR